MGDATFVQDLAKGEEAERWFLRQLQVDNPEAVKIEGYCKEYDIYSPYTRVGYEVKLHNNAIKTGDILIEIMDGGKLSGLMTTEAKWWILVTDEYVMTISPRAIKDCIIQRGFVYTTITGPGDTHSKRVVSIKANILRYYAEIMWYGNWRGTESNDFETTN